MDTFNRNWRIQLGDIQFPATPGGPSLEIQFEVTKSLWGGNKASLTVFNLSEEHRGAISRLRQRRRRIRVEISAGYGEGEDPPLLFVGDLRFMTVLPPSGGDNSVTIEGTDGGTKIMDSRFSKSFPANTPVFGVVAELVDSLGIGRGNLSEFTRSLTFRGRERIPRPVTFHGTSAKALDGFLESLGYRWSIQNGAFQLLANGHALQRSAVLLSGDTGLISASWGDRFHAKALCFLNPDIYPGRLLDIRGSAVDGGFRTNTVKYAGDSFGGDWTCDIEARVYTREPPREP